MEAELNLENETPIRTKAFRMPYAYRAEIQNQLSEYLKAGLISPCNSSYTTPIFAVRKKNGTLRIVTDYRKLNDITKNNYWPLPNIDDIFANIGSSTYLSTLDFVKGYHQIPM